MTKELWLTSDADGDLKLWTNEPIREENYWRNDRGEYLPTTETETLLLYMLGISQPLQPMQCVKVRLDFEIINNQPMHYSEVLSIIEGATRGDLRKVHNYSLLLAYKVEADGNKSTAERIRKVANGQAGAKIVPMNTQPTDEDLRSMFD